MIAVLWGLLAAVFVGTSDAIARKTSQHTDLNVLTLCVMALSTGGMTVWFLLQGNWPEWHFNAWLASAVSGSLNIVVLYLLYLALRRGPVSVASPAASTFTIMLVFLNALAGEPFAYSQLIAVVMVFTGIVMLAKKNNNPGVDDQYDSQWIRKTALIGLAAALAVALRMFLAQDAGVILGPVNALYLNRIFALIAATGVVTFLVLKNPNTKWPPRSIWGLITLQAALEALALGFFLIGSAGEGRIGASIGFSAFAAVTAIVTSYWLGERIGRSRALWMGVVVAGLMLAAAV